MNRKRFTLDTPEVKAILQDVWRSTKKSYYRITPEGKHVACKLKRELMALDMCGGIASRLLQSADLPVAKFIHTRKPNKPKSPVPKKASEVVRNLSTIVDIAPTNDAIQEVIENCEAMPPEVSLSVTVEAMPEQCLQLETNYKEQPVSTPPPPEDQPPIKKSKLQLKEEEREQRLAIAEQKAAAKRWSLIQQTSRHGTKFGIWNSESGSVICLFLTKQEAIEELASLKKGEEHLDAYHWLKRERARGTETITINEQKLPEDDLALIT